MIGFLTEAAWKFFGPHTVLVTSIRRLGEPVKIVAPQDLSVRVAGRKIIIVDSRGRPFSPDLVFHRVLPHPDHTILETIEGAGCRVINPTAAWRVCSDKTLQAIAFARHGVPHPETAFSPGNIEPLARMVLPGSRWLLKPTRGRRGRGIRISKSQEPLTGFLKRESERMPAGNELRLLQRFINHPGQARHHIRCHVVGARAVSAGRLVALPGRLITNHAQGGRWEAIDPVPPGIERLACAAAKAVGVDYAGVDLIVDRDGTWHVLEVNNMPDLRQPLITELARYLADAAAASRTNPARAGSRR